MKEIFLPVLAAILAAFALLAVIAGVAHSIEAASQEQVAYVHFMNTTPGTEEQRQKLWDHLKEMGFWR